MGRLPWASSAVCQPRLTHLVLGRGRSCMAARNLSVPRAKNSYWLNFILTSDHGELSGHQGHEGTPTSSC
eukprot:9537450-Prorocentrum_lima.AAC.1